MKNILKKITLLLCLIIFSGIFVLSEVKEVYAAEVGDVLAQPEPGWQRIDDSNSYIKFDSLWGYVNKHQGDEYFYSTYHYSKDDTLGSSFRFKFKGRKFRIIGARTNGTHGCYGSTEISVIVDGIRHENMVSYGPLTYNCLLYNLQGLDNGVHTVTIKNMTSNYVWVDAIDIDKDGKLLDADLNYVSNISLNKSALNLNIGESETLTAAILPQDADNKNLKWTSSNNNVCTVDENGKVTAIGEGNATVTAMSKDGSNIESSCEVKVNTFTDDNRGVFNIYMKDAKVFTYDLSMNEINDFITWFDNRCEGKGKSFYLMSTKGSGEYTKHIDCIRYDNIDYFSIDTYEE